MKNDEPNERKMGGIFMPEERPIINHPIPQSQVLAKVRLALINGLDIRIVGSA